MTDQLTGHMSVGVNIKIASNEVEINKILSVIFVSVIVSSSFNDCKKLSH